MSEITLGTANFNQSYGVNNNRIIKKELKYKIPKILKEKKITNIDTAFDYKVSNHLINLLKIKNLKVTTKFKITNNKNFLSNFSNNLLTTLKKIGIKKYEAVLFHDYKDLMSPKGKKILTYLKKLKKKKKIKFIGVSLYTISELKEVLKVFKPDIIQFPLNIFYTDFVQKKWLLIYKKKKIKTQIRSIFLQGILLKNKSEILKLKINNNFKQNLEIYNSWISKKNYSRLDYNISFIKKYSKYINYIIFGIDNFNQLNDIINAFKIKYNFSFKNFSSNDKSVTDPRRWQKKY